MTRADDLYILGVAAHASEAEIRSAYRTCALSHHPDLGGDARVMANISDAYERLLHPEPRPLTPPARKRHDPADLPDDFTIGHSMLAFVIVPVILAVILMLGVFSVLSTIL